MKKIIMLAFALLVSATSLLAQQPLTRTTVAQGSIEGVAEDGLGMFKGIPYAVPPIGELRWKAPVPAPAWQGTFKADTYQAMPAQHAQTFPGKPAPKVSEDCLYLNIMTPAKSSTEKLPVMVWIHGGGFITGSALSPMGNQIAKRGVVFVSIEYRTGALGFLALPELSKESPRGTSGNYGLMDQILALKWIKNNIAAFGGDPSKVTIFGESAGAIAVSMLCASPEAKGLFRGAISESGGSFCPVDNVRYDNNGIRDLKGAETHGVDFMRRMGAKNLEELRRMPFSKWVDDAQTTGVGGFWPCVDGYIITGDQYKLYQKGRFNDVNVMIGTNSDEGTMFVRPVTVARYESEVKKAYGEFADKVLALYPAKTDEETYYAQSDLFRETAFAWPSFAWASLQKAKGKSHVYMYYFDVPQRFSFGGPGLKARGAGHATELPYVFNAPMFGKFSPEDKALSDRMVTYWTNFAKTGNPNGEGLTKWPEFNRDAATVMRFSYEPEQLIPVPNRQQIDFMEDFFKWKRDNNVRTAAMVPVESVKPEEIMKYLKDCGVFFIATSSGDQPHLRPFGALAVYKGRLYIQTGKKKDVFQQMKANPKFEIVALKPTHDEWIRISGRLICDDTVEAKESVLEQNPDLKGMYSATDNNTAVLYIEQGTVTINSFTTPTLKVVF